MREREPVYAGKSLRAWLREARHSPRSVAAERAVRRIGTNAIPTLLEMLCEKDSSEPNKLESLWLRYISSHTSLPTWFRFPGWYWVLYENREALATRGFTILGADAQQAVPALMQIYERNISPSSRLETGLSLIAIGPAGRVATPLFLRDASSSNRVVRRVAVETLPHVKSEPKLIVPVLVNSLKDTDDEVRFTAAIGIAWFGDDARQAVPAMLPLLNDSNSAVREAVSVTLEFIDPEAAAKAGVKR